MVEETIITLDLPTNCIKASCEYHYLESKVKLLLSKACISFCSECIDRCCRQDICSESISSYWLRIIWSLCGHEISQYDDDKGWLSSYGCNLTAGRPPVCYEFFCNRMLEKIPKGTYLSCLKNISKLPSFVGKNALGNSHLVTLSSKEILSLLNFNRLRNRISKCLNLYKEYERQLYTVAFDSTINRRTQTSYDLEKKSTKKKNTQMNFAHYRTRRFTGSPINPAPGEL